MTKTTLGIAQNGLILTNHHRHMVNLSFTTEEIKQVMWSIPDDKAPGLDGFNRKFCKSAWPIVGKEIVLTII